MYFNDVIEFYKRTSFIFDGFVRGSWYTINKQFPQRANLQFNVSDGSSITVVGLDGAVGLTTTVDFGSSNLAYSEELFSEVSKIYSPNFYGSIELRNSDGSPILIEEKISVVPAAVSQGIPSKRVASILRIDNEGANSNDYFIASWDYEVPISLEDNCWVKALRLNLKGVLQDLTPITAPAGGGRMFTIGYIKITQHEL